jgi:hypothetical protein
LTQSSAGDEATCREAGLFFERETTYDHGL